jgi:4-alpha-glucanotransferase
MSGRSALRALAERAGILPGYEAATGGWIETGDAAREALLSAMGLEASSEEAARRSLAALDAEEEAALIEPVQVVAVGERLCLPLRLDPHTARRARFSLSIEREGGGSEELPLRLASSGGQPQLSARPRTLGPGEHTLHLDAVLPSGSRALRQTCLVTPARAPDAWQRLGGRRAFGLWANLYSLRSERSPASGLGDLAALHALVELAGESGAAFVGLSPLHAVRNRGSEISPYGPLSRLFRNPLYLDLPAIPEWTQCAEARAAAERSLATSEPEPRIDYERVAADRRAVLERLHREFRARHGDTDTERGRAYRAFRGRRGALLDEFAAFLALEDHFAARGLARDWHAWPVEYRDPGSAAVAAFRAEHAPSVDFHAWCQFELDRQLARLSGVAREAGLAIGLQSDLAVGSLRSGFDAWAFPGLFVDRMNLGAPPDAYAEKGQDWGFPPLAPRRLRGTAYRYWRLLLQAGFEHAGALRIDHALGLYRQYWVPTGRPAAEGAYVRFPIRDLLRLVALESQRHGALVIGEDLGTVPPGLSGILARHGVLSTRVLLFERDARGRFRPASRYSRRALVMAHTHDHPTLAAFWQGSDLELRRRTGCIGSDAALEVARADRERERAELRRRLVADGALAEDEAAPSAASVCAAAYRFLASTPSPLVGVSLDDVAGEIEPVNLPGVPQERYPSWTRRMREPVERLRRRPEARAILEASAARAGPRSGRERRGR